MDEYKKQWLQFITTWVFIISVSVIAAGQVLGWYNSLTLQVQPNHPVTEDADVNIKVHNKTNETPKPGWVTLKNGTKLWFDPEKFKR